MVPEAYNDAGGDNGDGGRRAGSGALIWALVCFSMRRWAPAGSRRISRRRPSPPLAAPAASSNGRLLSDLLSGPVLLSPRGRSDKWLAAPRQVDEPGALGSSELGAEGEEAGGGWADDQLITSSHGAADHSD